MLKINGERLWSSLMEMAKIGATAAGGVRRLALFPCVNGLSHNEAEDALPQDVTRGADVLLHALLARAGQKVSA